MGTIIFVVFLVIFGIFILGMLGGLLSLIGGTVIALVSAVFGIADNMTEKAKEEKKPMEEKQEATDNNTIKQDTNYYSEEMYESIYGMYDD